MKKKLTSHTHTDTLFWKRVDHTDGMTHGQWYLVKIFLRLLLRLVLHLFGETLAFDVLVAQKIMDIFLIGNIVVDTSINLVPQQAESFCVDDVVGLARVFGLPEHKVALAGLAAMWAHTAGACQSRAPTPPKDIVGGRKHVILIDR